MGAAPRAGPGQPASAEEPWTRTLGRAGSNVEALDVGAYIDACPQNLPERAPAGWFPRGRERRGQRHSGVSRRPGDPPSPPSGRGAPAGLDWWRCRSPSKDPAALVVGPRQMQIAWICAADLVSVYPGASHSPGRQAAPGLDGPPDPSVATRLARRIPPPCGHGCSRMLSFAPHGSPSPLYMGSRGRKRVRPNERLATSRLAGRVGAAIWRSCFLAAPWPRRSITRERIIQTSWSVCNMRA